MEAKGWWEQPAKLDGDPEWKFHSNNFGPGGYSGSAVERALPVVVGPINSPQEKTQFVPRLTAEGSSWS